MLNLKSIIYYAFTYVPFYHRLYKKYDLNHNDIKTLEDLEKFPVVNKRDLRNADVNELISHKFNKDQLNLHKTSGSTGTPFIFYVSKKEDDWRKAIYLRANISCGQKPRDKWAVITAPRHFYDTTFTNKALRIFSQYCISHFTPVKKQAEIIEELNPDVIDGYSGSIYLLAKEFEKTSKKVSPRILFGSTETIDRPTIKILEKIFDAPYYDQYGCSEMDRTAWQCRNQEMYHLDVDSVLTEFLDKDNQIVSVGESGEIVQTSLYSYSVPFIRYNIGDVGKRSNEQCNCGNNLPLMEFIEGRKDTFIVLPNDQLVSPRLLANIIMQFTYYNMIDQYRITQRKIDNFDMMIKFKNQPVDKKVFEDELKKYLFKFFNLKSGETAFNLSYVEEIPLTANGRISSIVSEVKVK